MTQSFTTILGRHFGAVPRRGLIALAAAAATTTVGDLVSLASEDGFRPVDIAMLVVIVGAYLTATYLCAMDMIGHAPSRASLTRYAVAQAIIWAPLAAAFGLFVLNPTGDRNSIAATALILFVIGILVLMLFPAWPIGQAVVPPIPPFTLLKATKGHRFWLFAFFSVGGSASRLVPSLDSVTGPFAIAGVLAGNFAVNVGTSLFYAALAVTSWQLASQKLIQDREQASA